MRLYPRIFYCAALFFTACAHNPRAGSLESLKPAVDTFHQRVRWKDFRGAAELVVPDRQAAFLQAREQNHDERDLAITEYELEDARLLGPTRALAVSRVSWTRLPSVSVKTETVTSEFVYVEGVWFLARQDAGPFAPELKAPYELPDSAAAH